MDFKQAVSPKHKSCFWELEIVTLARLNNPAWKQLSNIVRWNACAQQELITNTGGFYLCLQKQNNNYSRAHYDLEHKLIPG